MSAGSNVTVVDQAFVRLPNVSIILATSGIGVWMNPAHLFRTSTLRGRLGLAAARSGRAASIGGTWLSNGRRGCGSFNAARSSVSATAPVLPVSAAVNHFSNVSLNSVLVTAPSVFASAAENNP